MIVPEITYAFQRGKDLAAGTFDVILRRAFATNGQFISAIVYTVPQDRALILTSASIDADSITASEFPRRLRLQLRPIAGSANPVFDIGQKHYTSAFTQALQQSYSWSGQVVCPPGSELLGRVAFDTVQVSHAMAINITGISIPRANIQQS